MSEWVDEKGKVYPHLHSLDGHTMKKEEEEEWVSALLIRKKEWYPVFNPNRSLEEKLRPEEHRVKMKLDWTGGREGSDKLRQLK